MAIFEQSNNGEWRPAETAQGPFAGLQGGALAGLMVWEIERAGRRHGLGLAVSAAVEFHKPTQLAPLRTAMEITRRGRRVSFAENRILQAGAQTAMVRVCFIDPVAIPAIEGPSPQSEDPQTAALLEGVSAPHGGPWMWDSFEVRRSGSGEVYWFRETETLLDDMTPLARALVPADWTHGLNRPAQIALADPNVNLFVTMFRPPSRGFIGVRSKTFWTGSGVGMGEGELLDQEGPFGRVANSAALTPLKG